jgi:hypothetical protein
LLRCWFANIIRRISLTARSLVQSLFSSPISSLKWVGDDQQVIFAVTTTGELYRSTDAGKSWKSQLFLLTGHENGIRELVVMADQSEVVILGQGKRVWVSQSRGQSCKLCAAFCLAFFVGFCCRCLRRLFRCIHNTQTLLSICQRLSIKYDRITTTRTLH